MTRDIYKVIPLVSEPINDNLTGRDEVPKEGRREVGTLSRWLTTPMGQAYFSWARAIPKWDVTDMGNETVYAYGIGSSASFYVPARWNGVHGSSGRYYWVPIRIEKDLVAMAQAEALEIQNQAEIDRALAEARAAAGGGSSSSPYGAPASGMGTASMTGRRSGKELSLFNGKGGRIWYAMTKGQSAAQSGPHPGIFIAGPEAWDQAWGKPEENGLPQGAYLVSMDDPSDVSSVRPATPEFKTVYARATSGDDSAAEVLRDLGIDVPEQTGFMEGFGDFFNI